MYEFLALRGSHSFFLPSTQLTDREYPPTLTPFHAPSLPKVIKYKTLLKEISTLVLQQVTRHKHVQKTGLNLHYYTAYF